ITSLRPATGPWVRDDSGVYAGCTVSRFYDTLMAKLIVWGPDREAAIARMARALAEYKVVGVQTTIPMLLRIVGDPDFAAGRLSTHVVDRRLERDGPGGGGRRRSVALIAAALAAYERSGKQPAPPAPAPSAWRDAARTGLRGR